jgi:hypothetical protein
VKLITKKLPAGIYFLALSSVFLNSARRNLATYSNIENEVLFGQNRRTKSQTIYETDFDKDI